MNAYVKQALVCLALIFLLLVCVAPVIRPVGAQQSAVQQYPYSYEYSGMTVQCRIGGATISPSHTEGMSAQYQALFPVQTGPVQTPNDEKDVAVYGNTDSGAQNVSVTGVVSFADNGLGLFGGTVNVTVVAEKDPVTTISSNSTNFQIAALSANNVPFFVNCNIPSNASLMLISILVTGFNSAQPSTQYLSIIGEFDTNGYATSKTPAQGEWILPTFPGSQSFISWLNNKVTNPVMNTFKAIGSGILSGLWAYSEALEAGGVVAAVAGGITISIIGSVVIIGVVGYLHAHPPNPKKLTPDQIEEKREMDRRFR